MKKHLTTLLLASLGILSPIGFSFAFDDANLLQPAEQTTNFESIRVGIAGQGGVTFFNGSVLNESGPFVIADDLRVEGEIWRGPEKGDGDGQSLKIADNLNPSINATYDLGSSSFKWKNGYFSGDVYVGDLKGTGIINPQNISAANTPSQGQVLSYDGSRFRWVNSSEGSGIPSGSNGKTLRHNGTDWIATSTLYNNGTNIGIGTSSPTQKLQVNGNLFMSGGDIITDRWQKKQTNTLIGVDVVGADNLSTAANYNTCLGYRSGYSNTSGGGNTFIGNESGYNNNDGVSNVFIGDGAGDDNVSGDYNTFIGSNAGVANISGDRNVYVGDSTGRVNTSGSNNVFIGHYTGWNETGSYKLYVDMSTTNSPLLWGDFYNDRLVINGNSSDNPNDRTFYVNGDSGGDTAWANDSDARLKKNINTISDPLLKVRNLRGVNYEWIDPAKKDMGLQMGFIAQEAANVIPEVVDQTGDHFSMQYAPITALLVEAVKEQDENMRSQNEKISEQQERIDRQEKEIEELKQIICNEFNYYDICN